MNLTRQEPHTFKTLKGFISFLAMCTILAVLPPACTTEPKKTTLPLEQGYTQNITRAPITLKLETNKKELTVADQLELALEAVVPENFDVKFPSYGASLGDFTLRDSQVLPPRMSGSNQNTLVIHQARYLLEPYLAGPYAIPEITVVFRDKLDNGKIIQLQTEKIEIRVRSFLEPDSDATDIKDIKPPLRLPPDRLKQFLLAGLLLLLAALLIVGFLYWKKGKNKMIAGEVRLRPEEVALLELEKLLAENLLARGEIKHFHLRISDILRHYIENRFGLKAPERTTEEFFSELSLAKSPGISLLSSHQSLLADFLIQCDLVKFAKFEPTSTENDKTVEICREFIEKTMGKGEETERVGSWQSPVVSKNLKITES